MNVLLTGAFGNLGTVTLKELLKKGHNVRCFDIQSSKNIKAKKSVEDLGDFETFWGDITDLDNVKMAMEGIEAVIHLAGMIPPLSEQIPEVAKKVNIGGTENLLNVSKGIKKFVTASSFSIYGSTMAQPPPRKVSDELKPMDNYSSQKVYIEKMIKESGIPYIILRLAAVSLPKIPNKLDPIIFEIPLNQRNEFVDRRDCGIAIANTLDIDEVNITLNIGGGKDCQIYQRDYVESTFEALGISMIPESAFKVPKNDDDWYYTDWLDTEESQRLLNYQNISFKDYIEELKQDLSWRRYGTRIVSPFVKLSLLVSSPYYKFTKSDEEEFKEFDYDKLYGYVQENQDRIKTLEDRVNELEELYKKIRG